MPDQLTDQQIAEIEARSKKYKSFADRASTPGDTKVIRWFAKNVGALVATVRQLRTALSNADRVVVEAVKVNGDLQSQLEDLRKDNEELSRVIFENEHAQHALSHAVDLCNQKAAEYESVAGALRDRRSEAKAEAAREIREGLEKL